VDEASRFCKEHGHHPDVPCDHRCKKAVFPELALFIDE
jgi:hypothetical protein